MRINELGSDRYKDTQWLLQNTMLSGVILSQSEILVHVGREYIRGKFDRYYSHGNITKLTIEAGDQIKTIDITNIKSIRVLNASRVVKNLLLILKHLSDLEIKELPKDKIRLALEIVGIKMDPEISRVLDYLEKKN